MTRWRTSTLCLLAACLGLVPLRVAAQEDVQYRMELGGGIGGGFALTDLNSKFYGNTTLAGGAVVRFLLNPRMAIKTNLVYSGIKGATADVSGFYPVTPEGPASTDRLNYSFDGGVYDLSATYELNFLPYGFTRGYEGYCRLVPYFQAGFGLTYATSHAFSVNLPVGIGLKYKLARRLNVGLDWLVHFTVSDKLDGLEAPTGIRSSGFRNKDHYFTTLVTLTYDIFPRCVDCNKG